jgi:RND superfamily putative drug exporter
MLVRVGTWCFTNRWKAVGIWLVALAGLAALAGSIGGDYIGNPSNRESESQSGFDVIDEYFGGIGAGESGTIVFKADDGAQDPTVMGAMASLFGEVAKIDDVLAVVSPYTTPGQISPDGAVAFATVEMADIDQTRTISIGGDIEALLPDSEGLQIELGGESFAEFNAPETELIGLGFAVIVLIFAFGSVLAMGLPIGMAVSGVGAGVALTTLYSNVGTVPSFATTLGAMIGLGVGIDYALFIVTRYREALHRGRDPLDALTVSMKTAARAVMFAGLTVVLSLAGLLLIGLPFVAGLGISAAITVLLTMVASVTLLPALLGLAGDRVEVTKSGGLIAAMLFAVGLFCLGIGKPLWAAGPALIAVLVLIARFFVPALRTVVERPDPKPVHETGWYRWSQFVQARPWPIALLTVAVLIVMTIPVFSLRLGFSDEGNFAEDTTTRKAYDLLAEGFGPGFNGPILLAVDLNGADPTAVAQLTETVTGLDGVAAVFGPIPNDPADPQAVVLRLIPTTSPQDEATEELVMDLRERIVPANVAEGTADVYVTGFVAAGIDFSEFLASRTLIFFGVVLALSFLLLMIVFRSLLVPLKAVIMNILSIGAAYGVVIALFQWGWGAGFVGIPPGGPIEPFIPMMLFAIVFGLSMDYEVFLLSRMKEEYEESGDAVNSVAAGLASTARVITAAAAIMVVVFGSFLLENERSIKIFGSGLAAAVFLDATLVRMLLVPATMQLLGDKNWWIPKWLDRLLPQITVEQHIEPLEPSQS